MAQSAFVFGGLVAFSTFAGICCSWYDDNANGNAVNEGERSTKPASTGSLGGTDRYLTYVSTDKPIYRAGEKVYVRATLLHYNSRRPITPGQPTNSQIQIVGPKGDILATWTEDAEDSIEGFYWEIPPGAVGGQYKVKVTHPFLGHAPGERTFDIREYRAPRLKSQIQFLRDGYGAGDEVIFASHIDRAEGGVPVGATVTIVGRVDGEEIARSVTKVDSEGNASGRFRLPSFIRRGEGTLVLAVDDKGSVETASKTIPILLQAVDVAIYPEGGELVGGLANRVYFEGFTPNGKPADFAGVVVDAKGVEVAKFRSEHEGRSRFEFTPKLNEVYTMKINEPSGINAPIVLPAVVANGAIIRSNRDVYPSGEPISLMIGLHGNLSDQQCYVTLSKHEIEIGKAKVPLGTDGLRPVEFMPPDWADGVLRVTVCDESGTPQAERLIFRQPNHTIKVSIEANAERYVPAAKANIKIRTTDEHGKPVSGFVGLSVVDESVLEMIEKREQRPLLPTQVLLECDVKNLADAAVYFDRDNPKADLAVDLLLATQGWRRFAFKNPDEFLSKFGDPALRTLAYRKMIPPHAPAAVRGLELDKGIANVNRWNDAVDALALSNEISQGTDLNEELQLRERRFSEPNADTELLGSLSGGASSKDEAFRFGAGGRGMGLVARPRHPIRVYAHQVSPTHKNSERVDFAETLYWNAGLRTDERGEANFEFAMSDAVTSFRIIAEAFDEGGGLGSRTQAITSVQPFYIEPKMPLEITSGDTVRLPIVAVNATNTKLDASSLEVNADEAISVEYKNVVGALNADDRRRSIATLRTGQFNGSVNLTVSGSAGDFRDKVTRTTVIKPLGFPVEYGRGGMLNPGDRLTHQIEVPTDVVPGSFESSIVVYPAPVANLTAALERLIQEPCGCFEQTSSTTYPLIMAQQYFMSHSGVDPKLIERASKTLDNGYQRLTGFECKSGGYEWFGADPGHDALTAYGLLEFTEMSKVRSVDPKMLERTQEWLLSQRSGDGTFSRKTHTLHTWVADSEVATAYNVWALLIAKSKTDLTKEIDWLRKNATTSKNSYVIALVANILLLSDHRDEAARLLSQLAQNQSSDGCVDGATVSVIGSGGDALQIETTSLAVLAWLQHPEYVAQVERGIRYLAEQCKGGRFGSTQSTILALKAILAYDESRATTKAPGTLQLYVDDQPLGPAIEFQGGEHNAFNMPKLPALLTGKHSISIHMLGGSPMPYSVTAKFNQSKPASNADCPLSMEVQLRDKKLVEGNATEAKVTIANRSSKLLPTPIAIVGIPGGLEVRHDQLKELVKSGKVAAYEVKGREVILYWRSMLPEAVVDVPISLIAAIPGTYQAPASRAYLYYTDESKQWVDGVAVEIVPIGLE